MSEFTLFGYVRKQTVRVFERFFNFRYGFHPFRGTTGKYGVHDAVFFDDGVRDFDEHATRFSYGPCI